jgi:hypothetical protein
LADINYKKIIKELKKRQFDNTFSHYKIILDNYNANPNPTPLDKKFVLNAAIKVLNLSKKVFNESEHNNWIKENQNLFDF